MTRPRKPKLADLSRKRVDGAEDFSDLLKELEEQSDRGAALIGAAYVDMSLIRALKCNFANAPEQHASWFESEGGPAATFSRRIKLARAMCIIGPVIESYLDAIRKVRNQFAHAVVRIDFSNELIGKECKVLPDTVGTTEWGKEHHPLRRIYAKNCIDLSMNLDLVASKCRLRVHVQWMP